MIQSMSDLLFLSPNVSNTINIEEQRFNRRNLFRAPNVHVGKLVIRSGEYLGLMNVQSFAEWTRTNAEPTLLSKYSVKVNWARDGG